MSYHRAHIVHGIVGTFMLALILRTWLVMGIVEPVIVSGSSMAPPLRGPYVTLVCQQCRHQFDVGFEFDPARRECPQCGAAQDVGESSTVRADRLWIDRTAFEFRGPRRWEPIIFLSPDGGELTVKRVVGLPGELVELRDGDVWINDQVAVKSLDEMRAVRQTIHVKSPAASRWHEDVRGGWRWFRYRHPGGQPITNDNSYNAGMSQRLHLIRDFALSFDVRADAAGKIAIEFDDRDESFRWEGSVPGDGHIEVFAFDRRVHIVVDGECVDTKSLKIGGSRKGISSPFAVGTNQLESSFENLRLYRDIYHAHTHEELGMSRGMAPVKLGPGELFVLGDNVPVSVDSRRWGPIPSRLVVGRPLGVR